MQRIFACDANGNTVELIYLTENCDPAGLATCQNLNRGPLNDCVQYAYSSFAYQRAYCTQPEVLPQLCYQTTAATTATAAPETTIPGVLADVNRDGKIDILD